MYGNRLTPGYLIEPIKFLHPTVAKLAGLSVAVCERYYARLDMAVKAKELTEFEFGTTGGRGHEVMQYV